MIQFVKKVGEPVVAELWIYDENGEGVIGQTPKLAIRKTSDNKYLDFHDNTFKSTGWTTRQVNMTEFNATYAPGGYRYSWNSSLSVTIDSEYAIEYDSDVAGYTFDTDYVTFMLEDVQAVRKFMYNKRVIDKTLANPLEKLYDDAGTVVTDSWELTRSAATDARTPV